MDELTTTLREALTEAVALTSGPGNGTWTRSRPIEEWRRLDRLFRAALEAEARASLTEAAENLADAAIVVIGEDEDPDFLKPYVRAVRVALGREKADHG